MLPNPVNNIKINKNYALHYIIMASQTESEQKKGIPVVTLLTVGGTILAAIIPILLNVYSSQVSNKPDVNLAVTPNLNNDGRKALIELTNHGSGAAATNLSLTIQPPKNITSITNEFSSTDITIPKLNEKLLDMRIPQSINQSSLKLNTAKFSGGSGSMIKLETVMDSANRSSSYYNYTVSAAYDQGSIMGKVIKPSDVLSWSNFPNKIWEYIVDNPILVASEIAIIPAGWFTIKWWLHKRLRIHNIYVIINSIFKIRRDLISNMNSVQDHFQLFNDIWWSRGHFDPADMTLIDDLYLMLYNRFKYISQI
jgi:hypothetical protein